MILFAPLSREIHRDYEKLRVLVEQTPVALHSLKKIEIAGTIASITDVIAYQIGWGNSVICWYETGIEGDLPAMPVEGFTTWDYKAIAQHFFQKYRSTQVDEQVKIFHQVVLRILDIVENEYRTGNLDQLGVWPWCTLQSGKKWPLSKWIKINTSAPYKRAAGLIRRFFQDYDITKEVRPR